MANNTATTPHPSTTIITRIYDDLCRNMTGGLTEWVKAAATSTKNKNATDLTSQGGPTGVYDGWVATRQDD
ncbi:MAG: hypothetical protein KDA86_13170 [Planctomycetaceae bacterium]|nr:hypothetical protein [Planctomycetaceae bacterium]